MESWNGEVCLMKKTTVVIPNYNGAAYLRECLLSLSQQKGISFETIVVDNGSEDGSRQLVMEEFPEVKLICMGENTGFCRAVNTGIENAVTPYVILLNNDTKADKYYVARMTHAIEQDKRIFSVSAKMLSMKDSDKIDDAGDYYCALGWAYARGKGKSAAKYNSQKEIFAACGGAAIYRRRIFEEIGRFDNNHFAYLEDIDIGYRAKIYGYKNIYSPEGIVYHEGSGYSGSRYNAFKVSLSSKNSIYLIAKNMPLAQILINLPLLTAGFIIKTAFFLKKGLGREYVRGLWQGIRFCFTKEAAQHKVKFQIRHMGNYCKIQWKLWIYTILLLLREN